MIDRNEEATPGWRKLVRRAYVDYAIASCNIRPVSFGGAQPNPGNLGFIVDRAA
jgi:hypothetical protein